MCVWLTGPSGAGKSTVTAELVPLLEAEGRTVSVLDVVPQLRRLPGERSSEGKLLRKAYVAGEIARHGGIAVCVTVSARRGTRAAARDIVGADRFLEVFVEVPHEVARRRKAARGRRVPLTRRAKRLVSPILRLAFHGHVGYEAPLDPDLRLDGTSGSPAEDARAIVDLLRERGFLRATRRAGGVARPRQRASTSAGATSGSRAEPGARSSV